MTDLIDPTSLGDNLDSVPDPVEEQLRRLDQQIAEALAPLPSRRQAFLKLVAAGHTGAQAAREAGYSPKRADMQAHQVLRNIGCQDALKLLREKYALQHGRSAEWKRRQIERNIERAHLAEDHARASVAADKSLRTLLELDGDIRQGGNSGGANITISINTGLGDTAAASGVTIEGQKEGG